MSVLSPDRAQIALFVETLFRYAEPGTFISLRTFGDGENANAVRSPVAFKLNGSGFGPLIDEALRLADWAAQDTLAWVFCPPVVTFIGGPKATERDIANGLVLAVEVDSNPGEARRQLENILGPPTLVVESGGFAVAADGIREPKLHLYWRLSEVTRTQAEHDLLKRARSLAARLVDADCTNIPLVHPIRWAGSVHRKGEPRLARIVVCNEAIEIDLQDALERLEEAGGEPDYNGADEAFVGSVGGESEGCENYADGEHKKTSALIAEILSGANYHAPLVALAMRYILAGAVPGQVVETLRGIMLAVPLDVRDLKGGVAQPGRWQARYTDIPRLVSSAIEKARAAQEWPDPSPLPAELPPVPAFDPDLLPDGLRDWVMDIADRMQSPPDYVASAAIVGAGSVLGRKIGICPKKHDDWLEVPNLWGCIIGPPGVMKTPSMNAALASVRVLETDAAESNAELMKDHARAKREYAIRQKAAADIAKKRLKADPQADISDLSTGEEPKPPAQRRHMVIDATYEKLGEILQDNPNGVLAFRDELLAMLKPLDREEHAPARGFYLSAWSGKEGHTFDRIMRGHVHIPACCVSVLGSTQPNKFGAYVRQVMHGGGNDDGLVQRFGILLWPDVSPHWRNVDRRLDERARTRAELVFERLHKLTAEDVGADSTDGGIPFLRFTPEAQVAFTAWHSRLEHRLRSGELHPVLEAHFSKYRKLVPALALLFHLIDGRKGPVDLISLKRAEAWAEYLEPHAVRAYAAATQAHVVGARMIWKRVLKGDLPDPFAARDVQRKGWAGLTDKDVIAAALDVLVESNLVRELAISTGGRPSTNYKANPKAVRI